MIALIFFVVTFLIFLLPMLPSLSEWRSPTDHAPLRVVQDYDGDIRHFAHGWYRYVQANFSEMLTGDPREGLLNRDTPFQLVGEQGAPAHSVMDVKRKSTRSLVLSRHALTLADDMFFESEMYSAGAVISGSKDLFRALLADGDIQLMSGCTVLRWVHSGGKLAIGRECKLFGRTSAEKGITLEEGCTFERMHSACINFGTLPEGGLPRLSSRMYPVARGLTTITELRHVRDQAERRSLVSGKVDIDPRHFFDGDIVAGGDIKIGSGAHIRGSIKSNGDCVLGSDVVIEGSVFSARTLHVGPGCRIKGPVVAEQVLTIETGTIIGADDVPTSVNAPQIHIETGVAVYGTVWAGEQGAVVAPQNGVYSVAA